MEYRILMRLRAPASAVTRPPGNPIPALLTVLQAVLARWLFVMWKTTFVVFRRGKKHVGAAADGAYAGER